MNLRILLGHGIAWILALAFALLAGAHALGTLVLVPVWGANPPVSILAWLENPAAQEIVGNTVAFFRPLRSRSVGCVRHFPTHRHCSETSTVRLG